MILVFRKQDPIPWRTRFSCVVEVEDFSADSHHGSLRAVFFPIIGKVDHLCSRSRQKLESAARIHDIRIAICIIIQRAATVNDGQLPVHRLDSVSPQFVPQLQQPRPTR